jgi:hypothetical protein
MWIGVAHSLRLLFYRKGWVQAPSHRSRSIPADTLNHYCNVGDLHSIPAGIYRMMQVRIRCSLPPHLFRSQ